MMLPPRIIREPVSRSEIASMARQQFGDMVKAVVDVSRELMAVGGELHSDEEAVLLDDGSKQEHLWGINLYPEARWRGPRRREILRAREELGRLFFADDVAPDLQSGLRRYFLQFAVAARLS